MTMVAQYGLVSILSVFLIFHLLVLSKIIPYTIVWGGRLKSDKEMYRFELLSFLINSFFLFMILLHSSILIFNVPDIIMTTILWVMTALFAFNTLGNIVSKNHWEQRLFTPITIILTLFSLILALTN
jgi:hypothetical protein